MVLPQDKGHIVVVYDKVYPFQKGGGEKRLYEISRCLIASGWRVTWLGSNWWGSPKSVSRDGITFIGVGEPVDSRDRLGARRSVGSALYFSRQLLAEDIPDDASVVLIGQTPWLHYFAVRRLLAGRNVPVFVDCWEIWGRYWIEYYGSIVGRIGALIERFVLRKADGLIAISEMTRDRILGAGVSDNKVVLAHNGIDIQLVSDVPQSGKRSDLIYFGRLVPHKNVDVFIRALVRIRERFPDVRALVLGGGPESDRLRALAEDLGLLGNVEFLGVIESYSDAIAMMKASRVFVLPTTSEGGGCIALMEAHACGLPVVAVRHPQGIDPGLIADGENGLWVNTLCDQEVGNAVLDLLENEAERSRMSEFAQATAANFDWKTISRIYDHEFRRLTGS